MWTILARMSRSGDDLHVDIACVLIRGSKWISDEGSDLCGGERASGSKDSTLRTSDGDGESGEGTKNRKVYWPENLKQQKIPIKIRLQNTRKLEQ